ncbi:hypothetical protein [Natroniella sp. ANB-PHB2]|uniref:hypothetical protein n=1 Tax=Natroniella sp. ANB-PHB2 TaxID=3384444 RepID=UPI0038D375FA
MITIKTKKMYYYDKKGLLSGYGFYVEDKNESIPSRSTFKKPPVTESAEVAIFNRETEEWEVKADYKGQRFYDQEGNEYIIEDYGIEPKEDWSRTPPLTELEKLKQERDRLSKEFDQLAVAKTKLEIAKADQEEIEELEQEGQQLLQEITELNIKIRELREDE